MFGLFGSKRKSAAKAVYKKMDPKGRDKLFYGGADQACKILLKTSEILRKETKYSSEECLSLARDVYVQVWTRKRGMFDPEFSETACIKERLKVRFETIDQNVLMELIDVCVDIIYENEPKIKTRDQMMEYRKTMHLDNAKKNKGIELQHIEDAEYGLVPQKPVFVNGFGSDKAFLNRLLTDNGETVTYERLGSLGVEEINGPVDIYHIFRASGEDCGVIYVCNYGSTTPTVAPVGYKLRDERIK